MRLFNLNQGSPSFRHAITSLSILLTALSPLALHSQSFEITGSIMDDAMAPIPFCNILLLNPLDSSLVRGELTNDNGDYQFTNISTGDYLLAASFVGYNEVFQSITVAGPLQVEPITLSEGVALSEVQVVARKPLYEQKIDRLVVNVANTITTAGGTALEVLERSPGVIVNQQSNAVSLIGKEGVVIMINDKISYQPAESIIQMLAGMSADNIESIELITTPPANFDAEGNAGYINIKLKQRTDVGLNGNATMSAGYGEGEVGNAGLNLTYRKGKLSSQLNYGFLIKRQDQFFSNYRRVDRSGSILENAISTVRDPQQVNHNIRLGADYELSDKTVVGVLLTAYDNEWTMNANNTSSNRTDGTIVDQLTIGNAETNHWKHYGGNINVDHKISSSSKVTINLDYLNYNDNNPSTYDINFLDASGNLLMQEDQRSSKVTPIDIIVGQIDYNNTLSDRVQMTAGLKLGHSEFINTVSAEVLEAGEWQTLEQFTNESDLTEDIWAAFASMDYKRDSKNAFKVGLRYEYTDSRLSTIKEGEVVNRQFGRLFPSVFYTRTIDENQSLNLSYSKRITRPTFNDMAPFAIFLDPNTFFFGNAALQPAISNTYKVDYRYKSYLLSVQYTRQDSTIARFQDRVDTESNQQLFEPVNLSYSENYSASLSIPIYIGNKYTIQNNVILLHNRTKSFYDETPVELSFSSYNLNSSHSYAISDQLSAELSGFYNSAAVFGRSKVEPIYGINLGGQWKFRDGSSLRLNVRDVFNSIEFTSVTDIPSEGFLTEGTFDFSNRTVSLTYSFNFGNSKLKAARNRRTASEEERGRIN